MNYSLYLQIGGSMQAPTSDEQALAHKKEVDNQMAEAIKLNPASLDQAVQEYGEDAPSFIKHMIDVAAENQDEELLEILKPYAEKFNIMSFRCGGKVRAKIKKACSGKKMKKGGEAPIKKEAKGGKPCPCTLHKVGGKLIEVDCNGIPVAKNGTVLYAKPGTELPPALASQAVKNYMTAKPISSAIPFSDQWFGDLGKAFVNKMNVSAKKEAQDKPAVSEPVIGSAEWQALRRAAVNAYNKSPKEQVTITNSDAADTTRKQPEQSTWRQRFNSGKARYGGLTKEEALARQNEMLAAKAQGFNVDLGRWGVDGMWGNQSRSEWERYQLWKADQELAAQKAPIHAPMSAGEKFVSGGYASGKPWQDTELQNMDADQAIHLKAPDYNRWMQLNFNLTLTKPYVAPASPVIKRNGGKMSYADYLK